MLARTVFPIVSGKLPDHFVKFKKADLMEMLNKTIITSLDKIASFKCQNFEIGQLSKVNDIERETPIEFQKIFFQMMDVLSPTEEYARLFIRAKHRDLAFLFDLLFRLYYSE